MSTKQILKGCNMFQGLADAEVDKIMALATSKEYRAGEVIFEQGMPATDFFVLAEGKIALQTRFGPEPSHSKRVTVDVATANEVFGWSAVVKPHVYSLTAVSLHDVKAIAIEGQRFRALLHENHRIGYEVLNGLIDVVASRLDETIKVLISERAGPAPLA